MPLNIAVNGVPFKQLVAGGVSAFYFGASATSLSLAFTCGILLDSSEAYCMGRNNNGVVAGKTMSAGNTPVDYKTPQLVASGLQFSQLSADGFHGETSEAGQGGMAVCLHQHAEATPPNQLRIFPFPAVCGLLMSGAVRCWGRNDYGQVTSPVVVVSIYGMGGTNTASEPDGLAGKTFVQVVVG